MAAEAKQGAEYEAARWLVILEEEPGNESLRARFEDWLKADPANSAAWDDTHAVYDLMGQTSPVHRDHWSPYPAGDSGDIRHRSARLVDRTKPARRRATGWRGAKRLAMGAAAALTVCLLLLLSPTILLSVDSDYMTATSEIRAIPLPDGSIAHLGPDGAIAVRFDANERKIGLLRGKAFFEVAPEPNRPFRVEANGVTTTALGTAFEVGLGPALTSVAVHHGRVGVADSATGQDGAKTLTLGEWIRIGANGKARRGRIPAELVGAWRQGQIVARDRPVADVIEELRRYHSGLIFLTDATLGARHVSGVYNVADPATALAALVGALGGEVHQLSPWVLVVTAR